MDKEISKKAYELWSEDKALNAGKIVYEEIPNNERPLWAASLLSYCLKFTNSTPEFLTVINTAGNPDEWKNARKVFQSIRELTLLDEKTGFKNPIFSGMLLLAENTAKVTYNSHVAGYPEDYQYNSEIPAPFDEDSGWWIVQNLKYIVNRVDNVDFEKHILKIAFEINE